MADRLVILIALLNDAATLVIAVDNAKVSQKPDKWRLGQLITLSTVLGLFLTVFSFITYYIAKSQGMSKDQIGTIMYLQISSCPHFVIFSTRVQGWFWEKMPSLIFIVAILGTQVFAMFICVYGVEAFEAVQIGWTWGLGIIGSSLGCFVFLDAIKVYIMRIWSFELVAKLWPSKKNLKKLAKRKEQAALDQRVNANMSKFRKIEPIVNAVKRMKGAMENV